MGQQTHTLPADEWQLQAIQRSLVAETPDREPRPLVELVREHMESVAVIYERIIHQQQSVQRTAAALPAEEHFVVARHWAEQSDAQIMARLAIDSPGLFVTASGLPTGSLAGRNFFRVISAAIGEDGRYAALLKDPFLLERAVPVLADSRLVTDSLVRHPEDIAEMAHVRCAPELAPIKPAPDNAAGMASPVVQFARFSTRQRRVSTAAANGSACIRACYGRLALHAIRGDERTSFPVPPPHAEKLLA